MTVAIVGGRPLLFKTPADLAKAINKYFKETEVCNYTITGLCLAIGTSKQVLIDYGNRDDYREIVLQAKLFVENAYELSLRKNGRPGDIFALKNFGWRDERTVKKENTDLPNGLNNMSELERANYIVSLMQPLLDSDQTLLPATEIE